MLLGGSLLMNRALLSLVIGLDARCIHQKNLGFPAFFSLPLRPRNPGMTCRTFDSQSYIFPEIVKVKTAIGHVRPVL